MRFLSVAVPLALAVALPAAGSAAPSVLFSVDPPSVRITGKPGALVLSVPATSPVTWFSDRPARRAGRTSLRSLAGLWQSFGFVADPPNAALILRSVGEDTTHVVSLGMPRVAGKRVVFRVRAVSGDPVAGVHHVDPLAVGRYGRSAIFIDDAPAPPCPATVTSVPFTCMSPARQTVTIKAPLPPGSPGVQVTFCAGPDTAMTTDGRPPIGPGWVWRYFTNGFGTQGQFGLLGCNLYEQYAGQDWLGLDNTSGPLSKITTDKHSSAMRYTFAAMSSTSDAF